METTEPTQDQINNFMIYGAYGEVMHQFQLFELTLWRLMSRGIKEKDNLKKVERKVEAWDRLNFGHTIGAIKDQGHWPQGMVEELERAADARNYLAHHFLREYFLVSPSEENGSRAGDQLAAISTRLEDLDKALEDHLATLGVPSDEELDPGLLAAIDEIRPTIWMGGKGEHPA